MAGQRDVQELAQNIVTKAMLQTMPRHRPALLKELILHAAAALELTVGAEGAAEHIYRVADIVVAGDA